jgi:hypothetical protein
LKADAAVVNNLASPKNYAFYLRNTSTAINPQIYRIAVIWDPRNAGHRFSLTEIKYRDFEKEPNSESGNYDTGTLASSPNLVVAPTTISTPPPPDFRLYFTAKNANDSLSVTSVTLYLTYQDPGTHETVRCSLQPGQTAVKIP